MCLDGSSKGVSIVSAVYSSRYIASTPPNPAGIYLCIHVYTCIYICIYMYIYMMQIIGREGGRSVLTNLDIYIYTMCMYTCIYVYIHIYIIMYIHL